MGIAALVLMPERECATCTRQEEWGCNARKIKAHPDEGEEERDCWVNPALFGTRIDGEEVFVCPRRPILDNHSLWERILTYHRYLEKGFLPGAGGVQDQAAVGLQVLNIVGEALTRARAERDKE